VTRVEKISHLLQVGQTEKWAGLAWAGLLWTELVRAELVRAELVRAELVWEEFDRPTRLAVHVVVAVHFPLIQSLS
jgi:hypothetical protein